MGNLCKGNANNIVTDEKQQNTGNNKNVRQKDTSPTINENHEIFKETEKTKSAEAADASDQKDPIDAEVEVLAENTPDN